MAINKWRYYLGTPGNIYALPGMLKGSNPDQSAAVLGGAHVGLSGRSTLDVYSFKRVWKFSWQYLQESDLVLLHNWYRRLSLAPYGLLRFLDPRHTNVLSSDVASGGSQSGAVTAFTGSIEPPTRVTPSLVAVGQQVIPTGLSWTPLSTNETLLTADKRAVPVIGGSQYMFSCYVTGSGTYAATIQPYDVNQNALTAITGTATAASAGNTLLSTGRVALPSNAVTCAVGLTETATGTVQTFGWQMEIDPVGTSPASWNPGYGWPYCYVADMKEQEPRLGYFNVQYTVQET